MGKSGKPSLFGKLLGRRVQETYGSVTPPTDQLIDGLRAKYPEYRRYKPQLFTRLLNQTLDSDNNDNKGKRKSVTAEDDDDTTTSHKKLKQIDVIREETDSDSNNTRGVVTSEDEVANEEPRSVELELVTDMEMKTVELVMNNNKAVDQPVVKPLVNKSNILYNNNDANGEDDDDGPWFKDLGGMDAVLYDLKMKLIFPLRNPQLPSGLRVDLMTGILLHGPPGCGKTQLAKAIANEAGLPLHKISATELVSGVSGESEENIREVFLKASRTPSVVFIDEIDVISSKRETLQREMERRIVTQLMTCMDDKAKNTPYVLVIGATNRPDAIDPALRRPGRFDREIYLGVPDENARIKILSVLTRDLKLDSAFDLVKVSRSTPGFVGADLAALVKEAGTLSMQRITENKLKLCKNTEQNEEQNKDWWRKICTWSCEELKNLSITMSDFEAAAKLVQPSTKREGFSTTPDVKWEDIGGLDSLRKEFYTHIVSRIKYPDECEENGEDLETGFLLFGPPGCGKTSIAKAVANEAGANFIHIKGPELLNKYVGESELAVRTIFSRARTCSPCIIFFDEIDALTTKRESEGSWVVSRLLHQLLIELDGGEQRKGVYVIGATNKPNAIDPALLRPGRLGELKYVSLPNQDERVLILEALSKNRRLDADVDLIAIARRCENFSGDDLSKLMRKASLAAPKEIIGDTTHIIKALHFEQAFTEVPPSVSKKEKRLHDRMAKRLLRVS